MTRIVLVASCAAALPAFGFEPPRPSVEEALDGGQLAFIARVQALRETERRPTHTVAQATLVVLKCLYGRACRGHRVVQMNFSPDTLKEGALGMNLLLGREYLLVLKHDAGKLLAFGSQWPASMDVAFEVKTPTHPLAALEAPGPSITFENVWGGRAESVDVDTLDVLAERRRRLPVR